MSLKRSSSRIRCSLECSLLALHISSRVETMYSNLLPDQTCDTLLHLFSSALRLAKSMFFSFNSWLSEADCLSNDTRFAWREQPEQCFSRPCYLLPIVVIIGRFDYLTPLGRKGDWRVLGLGCDHVVLLARLPGEADRHLSSSLLLRIIVSNSSM